jgi:hypothetical protein
MISFKFFENLLYKEVPLGWTACTETHKKMFSCIQLCRHPSGWYIHGTWLAIVWVGSRMWLHPHDVGFVGMQNASYMVMEVCFQFLKSGRPGNGGRVRIPAGSPWGRMWSCKSYA